MNCVYLYQIGDELINLVWVRKISKVDRKDVNAIMFDSEGSYVHKNFPTVEERDAEFQRILDAFEV